MLPPAFSDSPESLEPREFEQLVQDGIVAVKIGDLPLAKRLLEQAALINSDDARIWIWLSATTEDLKERRTYLERALAADPSNATAKRGLYLVTEKLDQMRLLRERETYESRQAPAPEAIKSRTYICPNCGAAISYEAEETTLVCQFCGFTRKIDERVVSESTEQPVDSAEPATRPPRWVENQTLVACEQCGVGILLKQGQTIDSCPYCASNRFISPTTMQEQVDPQVMGLFALDPEEAGKNIKTWLGKGLLSPDNLVAEHGGILLHPAYYPFWIFDGTLELPWFCDVNVAKGKNAVWEAQTGSHQENFKGVLIPGLKKISSADMSAIGPFKLDELVEFSPDQLTNGVAIACDQPLADASLRARESIINRVRSALPGMVEPGHSKRNFSIGAGKWSGLTYRLGLLPIYIGNYTFQGTHYRLLVNGQTGKVSGKKPRDNFKLAMIAIGLIFLLLVIFILIFSIK